MLTPSRGDRSSGHVPGTVTKVDPAGPYVELAGLGGLEVGPCFDTVGGLVVGDRVMVAPLARDPDDYVVTGRLGGPDDTGVIPISRLPVAPSGNANPTQVVRSDDARLQALVKVGDTNTLTTTAKTSAVAAINELNLSKAAKPAWTTYSPTFNWTLGVGGSKGGRYFLDGKLLHVNAWASLGAGFSIPSAPQMAFLGLPFLTGITYPYGNGFTMFSAYWNVPSVNVFSAVGYVTDSAMIVGHMAALNGSLGSFTTTSPIPFNGSTILVANAILQIA